MVFLWVGFLFDNWLEVEVVCGIVVSVFVWMRSGSLLGFCGNGCLLISWLFVKVLFMVLMFGFCYFEDILGFWRW